MAIKDDLQKLLHGEPLTKEQREAHEEAGESFHVPAIVHRFGGVSANKLNACGICGVQIKLEKSNTWIAISDDEADRIRRA